MFITFIVALHHWVLNRLKTFVILARRRRRRATGELRTSKIHRKSIAKCIAKESQSTLARAFSRSAKTFPRPTFAQTGVHGQPRVSLEPLEAAGANRCNGFPFTPVCRKVGPTLWIENPNLLLYIYRMSCMYVFAKPYVWTQCHNICEHMSYVYVMWNFKNKKTFTFFRKSRGPAWAWMGLDGPGWAWMGLLLQVSLGLDGPAGNTFFSSLLSLLLLSSLCGE